MNVSTYLDRIQYTGSLDTSLETLRNLHYQHLLSIPLENLDIHYGRKIVLEPEALFTKIITQKRGGFCYELNGLFYELLRTLGFAVKRVSGRVYDAGNGFNDEFDHLAIVARIDDTDWLVDIGFGRRFPLYPLPIKLDQLREDRTGRYVITTHDGTYLAVKQQDETGDWVPAYIFTLTPRELADFASMCHYHQTSAESYFTQNKLCTLVTARGRITLTDDKLKITEHDRHTEQVVADREEFEKLLTEYFDIQIT